MNRARPIHKGERTHHQLQLITPHNLRTIKATPSSPKKPMPELELDDELMII
jgi:hypothetical protein